MHFSQLMHVSKEKDDIHRNLVNTIAGLQKKKKGANKIAHQHIGR